MPVSARTVIGNARRLLLDTNNATPRWSDAVLLAILNEGQKALAMLNPEAVAKTGVHVLAAGTHQNIPADGMAFLALVRNIDSSGNPGRAITACAIDALSHSAPNWHNNGTSTTAWQFCVDPVNRRRFYVFPALAAGVSVEVAYAVNPADIPTLDDALTVPDWYSAALVDYIIYRALSENDGDAPARERAQVHYVYFTNQVTGSPAYTPPRRPFGGG